MQLSERTKKILIIVGFAVLVLVLAWLLYTVFFGPSEQPPANQPLNNQPINNGLPPVGNDISNRIVEPGEQPGQEPTLPGQQPGTDLERDVETVTQGNAQDIQVNSQGQVQYYSQDDGRFYRYQDGEITPMTDQVFHNVDKVTWSSDGNKAVLEYPDDYNIVYDFERQKQISLPKEMQDFSFNTNGQKISAKVVTDYADNNWIVTANYDGSGLQFVEHLGDKARDVQIDWAPGSDIIGTYREGIDFERQEVFPISAEGANIKSLVVDGRGFESKWSPQGDYILYSVYNTTSGYRPVLYLSDMGGDYTGSYKISIGLNTWTDKCVFTNNSQKVYCAVPENLPELSGIYPELAEDIPEQIYEINLISGNRQLVAVPSDETLVNDTDLRLSTDGTTLYFVNQQTGQLSQIDLR